MNFEKTKPTAAELIYGDSTNRKERPDELQDKEGISAGEKIWPHLKNKTTNDLHQSTKVQMSPSAEAIEYLKTKENFKSYPYNDTSGHATIGYGHKIHEGNVMDIDIAAFVGGLSEEKAETVFKEDVKTASDTVNRLVKVPLTQNMHDALTSFTFNIGQGAFAGSTLLKKLNKGDYSAAAHEMPRWNKSDGTISKGLVRRRNEEVDLFYRGPNE